MKTDFSHSVIDDDGFRANVGIILTNEEGQLFWAKRAGMDAWQFPQGGIRPRESVEMAMYRELHEETGLLEEHVEVIGCTQNWFRYRLPNKYIRKRSRPLCIGQKQKWFLLKLLVGEDNVKLDVSNNPEFEIWRWIDFWEPAKEVIHFKRDVYKKVLRELEPMLFS